MVQEGEKAPAFALDSSSGKVALKDLAGKWVVLYFYPRDLTPGCTIEAEGFQAKATEMKKRNAVVVGVSKDSVATHEKFAAKCKLAFPLLSDPDGKVIKAYGAWGEKNMYGKKIEGILRKTVLIGPDGKVKKVFPKVKPAGHADEIISAIDEAGGRA